MHVLDFNNNYSTPPVVEGGKLENFEHVMSCLNTGGYIYTFSIPLKLVVPSF